MKLFQPYIAFSIISQKEGCSLSSDNRVHDYLKLIHTEELKKKNKSNKKNTVQCSLIKERPMFASSC